MITETKIHSTFWENAHFENHGFCDFTYLYDILNQKLT